MKSLLEKIGLIVSERAGLADESVCPTLSRNGLQAGGAGAFACCLNFSQLLTRGATWHASNRQHCDRKVAPRVGKGTSAVTLCLTFAALASAADIKVDLSKEQTGKPPTTFEPIVGTWLVVEDGGQKVIMVDGRPWVASKDNPTKLLLETARKLYGTSNEELMDNAKQFAYYPVAILKSVDNFSNGSISLKFKTVAGDADRCSGILFNVKPTGDWLAIRYNDTENNVGLWEFHNGIRRNVKFSDRAKPFMLDRSAWHELKLTIDGSNLQAWLDGTAALDYTLGSEPVARRGPPNPDLFPANNPVLRPPVQGKIGLWSKTDSTSYFKDYVVSPR